MEETIRASELKQELNGEQSLRVIDIRAGDAFAIGHIPGALNIPIKRMQYNPGYVPDDLPIVLYTSQGELGEGPTNEDPPDENMVHETAAQLRERGYQVRVLEGGLNAWIEAGLPIELE
jgi:rhodanese-related sulfurtransferase